MKLIANSIAISLYGLFAFWMLYECLKYYLI